MSEGEKLDQTDRLILYLLSNLTKGAPHLLVEGGGVLTTMLAKLLFLIDVWSMQISGIQATDFRYIRYKFGPYPLKQFEERLDALQSLGVQVLPKVSVEEEKPYRIYRLTEEPREPLTLPPLGKLLADEVITTFASQTLENVLTYIYQLDFVRNVSFGQEIDISVLRPKEDTLTQVLKSFERDLAYPVSEEHSAALQKAMQEPSNENIELAQAMIESQQKAFRFKQGS